MKIAKNVVMFIYMYLHKVGSNIYATSPEVPVSIIYYSWQRPFHVHSDTLP